MVVSERGGGGGGRRAGGGVCDALVCLLDGVFIGFVAKLYRQTNGIPMGAGCAPLVADLFLFCYGRDFAGSLSREGRADMVEAFSSASRCLGGLLDVDSVCFEQVVDRMCSTRLHLGRANSSDTEALVFGFESMYIYSFRQNL